jgi:hypothetical protein
MILLNSVDPTAEQYVAFVLLNVSSLKPYIALNSV